MRRSAVLMALVGALTAVAACVPSNPGPTGLYLGKQADIQPVVTPKDRPVTWGSAPPIDEHYGGTLYEGTAIETQDPRPLLLRNGDEPLRLWVADPDNGMKSRPAIIWLHGGGFAVGIDSMYALANSTGREYAQRGYVSFSVEYRTDTTLVGPATAGGRPASLCQWVQDNENPGDPTWEARREQCKRNIIAAQQDIQGAVRWIRKHARRYDVDPTKIAVGGFSAGAVTAANLAYRSDDVGTNRYFPGDRLSVSKSRVQGAIGASGCLYSEDGGPLTDPGPGDAPISFIHSRYDGAVPYECIAETVTVARSKGLVAELTSYCTERGHAAGLYATHKAATDEQWTTFLARQLNLYSGMRPPSADPVCPRVEPLERHPVLDALGIPLLDEVALTTVYTTGFENPDDLAGFYVTPQSDLTRHEIRPGGGRRGDRAHVGWLTGETGVEPVDGPNHRGYPTIQLPKRPVGTCPTPCLVEFWARLEDVQLDRGEWFSLGTFTSDPSDRWSRVVTVNVGWEGWLHVFHVPDQGLGERELQRTDIPFPQGRWVRITTWLDLDPDHGAVAVWQDGVLVSAARVRGGDGSLDQLHFGLYAPPSLTRGAVANDDIAVYRVTARSAARLGATSALRST